MNECAGLRGVFGGRLVTAPEEMAPFCTDWRKLWHGKALAIAQPETTEDVARLVRHCAAAGIPVVPQGGNTGLSGGATPDESGTAVVVSLARLNRIRALDRANATLTAEAGCVLAQVQDRADAAGLLFPLSLASQGSCTIGGVLATNAGGVAVLRYGTARALCLGLEVVLADGQVWNGLRGLRKDNAGYDLKQIFIGSEGTLGIITAAVLQLFAKPTARVVALLGLASPVAAVGALRAAREAFGFRLGAAELFSDHCIALVRSHVGARAPFEAPWYLLVQIEDCGGEDRLGEAMEEFLGSMLERHLVCDATLAGSLAQSRALWSLREHISESQGKAGPAIKHDISVPLGAVAAFIAEADELVAMRFPDVEFVTFGHAGDGNLHYNFSPAEGTSHAAFLAGQDELNTLVHEIAIAHGGSVSAEHGLGQLRHREAAKYRPAVETALMRRIKQALDPHGVLNPGKVLP